MMNKITTEFPKLKDCGGMELLRSMSNCRLLQVIDGKWDVATLKSLIGSQCNIYVRPIQKSVSVEIDTVESKNQMQEMCKNCLKNILLVDLRSHLEECKADSLNDEQSATEIEFVIPMDTHEETEDTVIIENVLNLTDLIDDSIHGREIDPHSNTVEMHQPVIINEPVFTERVGNPEETFSVSEAVEETVQLCEQNNINNPVEILQLYQKKVVTGRKLDLDDETGIHVGSTNFILVDRYDCLRSSMEEIRTIEDPRLCLEVQFYGELASRLPVFVHLFTPQTVPLTFRMLSTLLKPNFSIEGSNQRIAENTAYQQFNKYLREAAAGRRQGVSLNNVLRFVTGAEEEPVLGFAIHPSLHFVPGGPGPFLPSANTCSNRLNLPVATNEFPLPPSKELFGFFDLAFLNTFFGYQ